MLLFSLLFFGRRGKRAGDWFGPTCIVHVLKEAVEHSPVHGLKMYVAQDCTVFIDDVNNLCRSKDDHPASDAREAAEYHSAAPEHECYISNQTAHDFLVVVKPRAEERTVYEIREDPVVLEGDWTSSLLLCVPLRLGTERVNPIYVTALKTFLAHKSCVGVIGGKPKHSLYFIGFQVSQGNFCFWRLSMLSHIIALPNQSSRLLYEAIVSCAIRLQKKKQLFSIAIKN